jgi:hypothetical protein
VSFFYPSIKARISKILVPLDGSESAMDAVDYAQSRYKNAFD